MAHLPSSTTPSFAIGIDFGTTYCCVAVLRPHTQEAEVIQSDVGANTTPSYVAYILAHDEEDQDSDEDEKDVYAGEAAKEAAYQNPESTIFDIKRLIGRSFYDPHVQKFKTLWPFHLVNISGLVGVKVGDEKLLPQVVATVLLSHLKKTTEDYLGCPINSAVVTIPVYYNDMQKDLTLGACQDAGFSSIEFIAEPVAAAVAYGLQSSSSIQTQDQTNKTCLIFDLGGGTFDVTVFKFDSTSKQVKIVASGGDDRLGGEDFNDLLTEYCIQEFKKITGIDLAAGKTAEDPQVRRKTASKLRRIRKECEKQKCFLTSIPSVVISLDGIHVDHQLVVPVTRRTFEDIIGALLTKTIKILEDTLKQYGFAKDEIDDVILIGGSSRIPKVQAMVQDYFEGKHLHRSLDADEAVACGAAIHAHNIFTENVQPFSVVTLKENGSSAGSTNKTNTKISVAAELQQISLHEPRDLTDLSENKQPWCDIQLPNSAKSRSSSQLFGPTPDEQLLRPWREIKLSNPAIKTGSESYGPFITTNPNQVKQPRRKLELSKFSKSSSQLHEPIPTHQLEQPWREVELSKFSKSSSKPYGSSLSLQPPPIPHISDHPQKPQNIGAKYRSSDEADHDRVSKAHTYKTGLASGPFLGVGKERSRNPLDPYAGASEAYSQRESASRVSSDLENKSSSSSVFSEKFSRGFGVAPLRRNLFVLPAPALPLATDGKRSATSARLKSSKLSHSPNPDLEYAADYQRNYYTKPPLRSCPPTQTETVNLDSLETAFFNQLVKKNCELPEPTDFAANSPPLLNPYRQKGKGRQKNGDGGQVSESRGARWECPHCTFVNFSFGQICEICENNREYYVDEVIDDKFNELVNSSPGPTTAIDRSREGTLASYLSAMRNSIRNQATKGEQSQEMLVTSATGETMIECPHCTLLNPNYRVVCECCQKRLKKL